MKFEIGENRAPRFGTPTWAGEWPVLVDGRERATIIETERGYRLREGDGWLNAERPSRSAAEDDARNRYGTWRCVKSHPVTGTQCEEAEINGAEYARVTVAGVVTFGPSPGTGRAHEDYQRRIAAHAKGMEKNA